MSGFENVIGYETIKTELMRYCDVLKYPEKYKRLGISAPRGVMLYGDPGLGKTTMARAFIEESGRRVLVLRKEKPNGDFVNEIGKTFEKAKELAPAIVFLDDLDKFANEDYIHRDAEEYVAVQAGIDSLDDADVFVIATANDANDFPDSLTRAGRFDKTIEVKVPKGKDASAIIKHYLKNKQIMDDVDTELIERIMDGRSCAELETVINEAGIYAGYEGRDKINQNDFLKACLRMVYEEMNHENDDDKTANPYIRDVAIHEAGHAVIAEILNPGSVNAISIGSFSGTTEGVTSIRKPDGYGFSKKLYEHEVLRCLGGRAAIGVILGKMDVGCSNDLNDAIEIVEDLVSGLYGPKFSYYHSESETFRNDIEKKILTEMERYYQEAQEIIAENRCFLEEIVEELMNKEVLTYRDINRIKKSAN